MCNRARLSSEPEMPFGRFGAGWADGVVRPNRDPVELSPKSKAFVVRQEGGGRIWACRNGAGSPPDREGHRLRDGDLRSERPRRADLHPKAMITILPDADRDRWLSGS